MCAKQYEIWITMDNTPEVRAELDAFVKRLKEAGENLYKNVPGKKMMLLRMTNNKILPLLIAFKAKRG